MNCKKLLIVSGSILLFLNMLSCSKDNTEVNPVLPEDIEYELVFEDEFEGMLPNPENWGFEHGFVRNEELQWYQEENAYCKDGKLVIEGRRERVLNPNYNQASNNWRESREFANYTSSSLNTKGKHSWLYGRIEVKARIDARRGLWPAIWTLGIEGEWPSKGEIDIMEYYKDQILANFAWGTTQRWVAKWDSFKKPINDLPVNWASEFHVWRLDWTEDKMEIYLDDQLMNRVYLHTTINPTGDIENPFKQPHYLLLNLAIGSNGGDPSNTTFPRRYEIDYVRVYKEKE
jgi:beta-glucanase (GH16 family)